jgi:hypothetical protein
VTLYLDAMLDCHEIPLERRYRELEILALLHKVVGQLYVVKIGPGIHDDCPDDAAYYLRGVCLLILHRKWVTKYL